MNTIKTIIVAFSLIMAISSCSKEEDEVPLADPGVSAADFDSGFLGLRLVGASSMVDSIIYTNTTKGNSFHIDPSSIVFIQALGTGLLYKPLHSGNTGDVVECCVYVNTATELGVSFRTDTIILNSVSAGLNCYTGTY